MHIRTILAAVLAIVSMSVVLTACSSGSSTPPATATPSTPGPVDVIADWVKANRNVDFVGDCADAKPGVDVGKLCASQAGSRGTRRAYYIGPTFSDYSALAIVEQKGDVWSIVSVNNRDPSALAIPGIAWPLQIGDQVVVIGLGEHDCLRVHDEPSQQAKTSICLPDGTKAIIQEGPVDAENYTWWKIAGDGFTGWAAGTWLRLPEAIAQALQPPTPTPTAQP